MQEWVREFGFVVLKGADLSESECEAVCNCLGEPVTFADEDYGYGYSVLVHQILTSEDVLYQHSWETGDLLLANNYMTLHGRDGFGGQRWLMNGQIVVPAWSE